MYTIVAGHPRWSRRGEQTFQFCVETFGHRCIDDEFMSGCIIAIPVLLTRRLSHALSTEYKSGLLVT